MDCFFSVHTPNPFCGRSVTLLNWKALNNDLIPFTSIHIILTLFFLLSLDAATRKPYIMRLFSLDTYYMLLHVIVSSFHQ